MVRILIALLGVVSVLSLCFLFPADAQESLPQDASVQGSGAIDQERHISSNLESILAAGLPESDSQQKAGGGTRSDPTARKAAGHGGVPLMKASAHGEAQASQQNVYAGTLAGPIGKVLFKGIPDIEMEPGQGNEHPQTPPPAFRPPSLVNPNQMHALLKPGGHLESVAPPPASPAEPTSPAEPASPAEPTSPESKFKRLEIEVSYNQFHLKLLGESSSGQKDLLYQCDVALGAPEFDTPKGSYFVTHIYDREPWWIPPPNRAWAAGQSPSRKVYGGYMAPLLKKKAVRVGKNTPEVAEDKIEGQYRLEDWGYRFHGTNAPRSIRHRASHGCVRMLPKDVEKVVALIKENIPVVERLESVNGSFVLLGAPIRLNIVN